MKRIQKNDSHLAYEFWGKGSKQRIDKRNALE